MKHLVFSVHDAKAEAYLPPFLRPTYGMAMRDFEQTVNSQGHPFCMYPEDHILFCIGEYDDSTGKMTAYDVYKSFGNGLEHKKQPAQENQNDLFVEPSAETGAK